MPPSADLLFMRSSQHCRMVLAAVAFPVLLLLPACTQEEYDPDAPAAALDAAAEQISFYNFEEAYDIYAEVRPELERGDALWLEATYGLAVAAWQSSPPSSELIEEADQLFAELIAVAPNSRFAPESWRNRGRIRDVRDHADDRADPDAARPYYARVFEQWPGTQLADEAAIRYGLTHLYNLEDAGDVAKGVEFLEGYFRERQNSPLASIAYEILATWADLQAPHKALQYYLQGDAMGYVDENKEGINYWIMAGYAEREGRWDVAVKYYQKIIREKPYSGRSWEAMRALRKIRREHPDMDFEIPPIRTFSVTSGEESV